MKQVILSAALALVLLASCKQNEPTADPAPTPPPVEDPAPPARPEPTTSSGNNSTTTTTTTTTTEEEPNGTSVNIGRDGVDISTKDDNNNVKMSTKTKEVQIKTTTDN